MLETSKTTKRISDGLDSRNVRCQNSQPKYKTKLPLRYSGQWTVFSINGAKSN